MAATIDSETGEVVRNEAFEIIAVQEKAANETAVDIAKRYPRSIEKFKDELLSWATGSKEIAAACFFTLPTGGKKLIGPSIRFAELVSASWGNIAVETRVLAEEDEYVIVEGTCRDLERNVTRRDQVRRSVVGRNGQRYQQSVVETTILAASAIASRNAILKVVPQALWAVPFNEAKNVSLGEGKTFAEARDASLDWLVKNGVPIERLFAFLEVEGRGDMTRSDVLSLNAKAARLHSDESTIEQEFPENLEEASSAAESRNAANAAVAGLSVKQDASKELEDEVKEKTDALRKESPSIVRTESEVEALRKMHSNTEAETEQICGMNGCPEKDPETGDFCLRPRGHPSNHNTYISDWPNMDRPETGELDLGGLGE